MTITSAFSTDRLTKTFTMDPQFLLVPNNESIMIERPWPETLTQLVTLAKTHFRLQTMLWELMHIANVKKIAIKVHSIRVTIRPGFSWHDQIDVIVIGAMEEIRQGMHSTDSWSLIVHKPASARRLFSSSKIVTTHAGLLRWTRSQLEDKNFWRHCFEFTPTLVELLLQFMKIATITGGVFSDNDVALDVEKESEWEDTKPMVIAAFANVVGPQVQTKYFDEKEK